MTTITSCVRNNGFGAKGHRWDREVREYSETDSKVTPKIGKLHKSQTEKHKMSLLLS